MEGSGGGSPCKSLGGSVTIDGVLVLPAIKFECKIGAACMFVFETRWNTPECSAKCSTHRIGGSGAEGQRFSQNQNVLKC